MQPQTFIDALTQLEADGSPDALVDLYAEESVSDNLTSTTGFEGRDGAREFWETDRGLFDSIESSFHSTVADNGTIVLEWTRRGSAKGGDAVEYDGVSVIEHADDKITRFRAYYDPSHVL